MFGTIAKKVYGGHGDAVGGLVDGDHLVFGTIAKKVDGGQGDAVVDLVDGDYSVFTSHGTPLLCPHFPFKIPPLRQLSSSSILVLMVNC